MPARHLLPVSDASLLAAIVDESLTRVDDGLHVQQDVVGAISEARCASALDVALVSLRYACEGRGLHAYLADCAARVVERLEEDAGTSALAPVEFVACVNASGEGEIVVVPSVEGDDDGDQTEARLRDVGYAAPFVFLGSRVKGPFTPLGLPRVALVTGEELSRARRAAAQEAYEAHDFGALVGEASGWETESTDGPVSFRRTVFLEPEAAADGPSRACTFAVVFAAGSATVSDRYVL